MLTTRLKQIQGDLHISALAGNVRIDGKMRGNSIVLDLGEGIFSCTILFFLWETDVLIRAVAIFPLSISSN